MSGGDEAIIREITKLSTKMDIVCQEINELKHFTKTALERLTVLEQRLKVLEDWKEDMTRYQRLKTRFSYDLRSAVAGGIAGGGVGALLGWLIRLWG